MSDTQDFTDWPREVYSGRLLCTPERPMPKGAPGQWAHNGTREVGEQENGYPGGDIIRCECRNCGHTWREELPQ
jgi:hypothetical protein